MEAGNIFVKGRHIKCVTVSPRVDFSRGRNFNLTPATAGLNGWMGERASIDGLRALFVARSTERPTE